MVIMLLMSEITCYLKRLISINFEAYFITIN